MVDPHEAGLNVADGDARRRQHTTVVLSVLMLTSRAGASAESGDMHSVHRIAAEFIIQVCPDGIDELWTQIVSFRMLQLARDCHVEYGIA